MVDIVDDVLYNLFDVFNKEFLVFYNRFDIFNKEFLVFYNRFDVFNKAFLVFYILFDIFDKEFLVKKRVLSDYAICTTFHILAEFVYKLLKIEKKV
ncbi:MAG: hypothetical protein RLZZ628_4396 [Bacteroidota bacterium]|jgi:hypothetical protein